MDICSLGQQHVGKLREDFVGTVFYDISKGKLEIMVDDMTMDRTGCLTSSVIFLQQIKLHG